MALSFQLTSRDFRGVVNRRFWANFLPFPATNSFYLEVGTPNFTLFDVTHDREVELRAYRDRGLLLAFTRIFTEKQYCPFCYPHLVELSDRYAEFQALGVEVWLITSTDRAQSQQVVKDLGLQMPLLSDPSCGVFRTYGLGQALGAPLPAQFMLDRAGKLRYRHLFSLIEPNAPIDRLLEQAAQVSALAVAALKPAEPAPPSKSSASSPESLESSGSLELPSAESPDAPTNSGSDTASAPSSIQATLTSARSPIAELIVEPQIEPMPDVSAAMSFAARSTQMLDDCSLETIEPELEPLPQPHAPLQRRQPWLDKLDTADAAIEGEIVSESALARRPRPTSPADRER